MSLKKRIRSQAEGIKNIQDDLSLTDGTGLEAGTSEETRANITAPRWLNRNRHRRIKRFY